MLHFVTVIFGARYHLMRTLIQYPDIIENLH